MSDFARGPRGPNSPAPSTQADANTKVFRSLRPGEIGPARMNPVHEERAAATAQIQRSLTAWRSASGTPGKASIPKGAGAPLPAPVRAKMEPKLGADLSNVRLHTGSESADAAKGFGARAFTIGEDVHFNAGEFNPGSKEGDKLLAHELTHVVQGQKSGIQRKPEDDAAGGDEQAGAGSGDAPKADGGQGGGEPSASTGKGGV